MQGVPANQFSNLPMSKGGMLSKLLFLRARVHLYFCTQVYTYTYTCLQIFPNSSIARMLSKLYSAFFGESAQFERGNAVNFSCLYAGVRIYTCMQGLPAASFSKLHSSKSGRECVSLKKYLFSIIVTFTLELPVSNVINVR